MVFCPDSVQRTQSLPVLLVLPTPPPPSRLLPPLSDDRGVTLATRMNDRSALIAALLSRTLWSPTPDRHWFVLSRIPSRSRLPYRGLLESNECGPSGCGRAGPTRVEIILRHVQCHVRQFNLWYTLTRIPEARHTVTSASRGDNTPVLPGGCG